MPTRSRVLVFLASALLVAACGEEGDRNLPAAPETSARLQAQPGSVDGLTAIHLGTLGGQETQALDVNEQGQVVGWSENEGGDTRPFLWTAVDGMRDLGTLGGGEGVALALNGRGTIVGWSRDAEGRMLATRWDTDGTVVALPGAELQGGSPAGEPSAATAINAGGTAVGWTHGAWSTLWAGDGSARIICDANAFPSGINAAGEVAGVGSGIAGSFIADPVGSPFGIREFSGFLWSPRGGGCEPLIDQEFVAVEVGGLNDLGVVAGLGGRWEDFDPPLPALIRLLTHEPFLFAAGRGFESRPGLPAVPRAINNRGLVVGDGIEGLNERGDRVGGALLWTARPRAFRGPHALPAKDTPAAGASHAARAQEGPDPRIGARDDGAAPARTAACPGQLAHLVRIGALPECPQPGGEAGG